MIAIQCIFKEVGFMQLYEAIELGLFTVLPAVILVLAFLLGLKRNIFQSAAKLICVILSVVVSAIVVKVSLPPVVPVLFDFLQGEISPEILNYLQTSSAVKDLLTFASALLMPVVFFFVFIVAWLVFAILYFIPGTILSKRSFARRAARKAAKQAVAVPACESVDQPENPVEIQEKKGVNWAKVGMKVGSVVLNVGAAFIGLAFFAMPISYYANLAYVSLDAMESAEDHQEGCEEGQNGVELNGDAEDHALCPVIGLLGQNVDGSCCNLTLSNCADAAADCDGQACCEVAAAVNKAHVHGSAIEQTHLINSEEPNNQTVKTLGAGDNLHNHNLTELGRILSEKTCACFTGNTGAACRACTCKAGSETCAEKTDCKAGILAIHKSSDKFHFYISSLYAYIIC